METIHAEANKEKILYKLCIVLLVGLLSYLCFYKLGFMPIQDWDEARHGVSAYEMLQSHSLLVNTYNFRPDYWNLKPPLSFWAIMGAYKVFGFNAFALRFPSAFAYFITIILLAIFLYKEFSESVSVYFLLLSCGIHDLIFAHAARSGNADSLFIFFFALSMVGLYYGHDNIKGYYLCGIGFGLAFLTKSFHAGVIPIIAFLYYLVNHDYRRFKIKEYSCIFLSFVFLICIWGMWRYTYDGMKFFTTMVKLDLLRRSSNYIEGHTKNVWFYFKIFIDNKVLSCSMLAGLLLIYKSRFKQFIREKNIVFILWIVVPLLFFTLSKTKLFWYIYPAELGILVFGAICLGYLRDDVRIKNNSMVLKTFLVLIFIVLFYQSMMNVKDVYSENSINDIQTCISNVPLYNKHIYIQHSDTDKRWRQSELLAAELYHNFRCMKGGYNEFLQDKSALLIYDTEKVKNIPAANKYLQIYKNGHIAVIQNVSE